MLSVNTNIGAMAALQSLTQTNKDLETTQSRINTTLKVNSTKDDSASYTIAQKLRGDVAGLGAVSSSLSNAKSVTDVAVSGVEQISDLLNQMKAKATQAADPGLVQSSRDQIAQDVEGLKNQISTIIGSSDFNGINVLKNGGGTNDSVGALKSLQDSDSTTAGWQADTLTVANQDLDTTLGDTVANGGLDFANAVDFSGGATSAEAYVAGIDASIATVKQSLTDLGAASREIDQQITFTSKLSDTIEGGIGNLVDADMAKESARLQALQVKQQLGVQALSIANQAPQTIISLFR